MSEQASSRVAATSSSTVPPAQDVALRLPELAGRARLRKWLTALVALIVLALLLAYFLWPEPAAERFRTLAVSQRTLVQLVEAAGRVDVRSRIQVPAPIEGQLVAIHVKEGQLVEAGDLLAELDPRAPELALQGARASASAAQGRVAQARAAVSAAEQALTRAGALRAKQLASPVDVSNAESELARARAGLRAAQGEGNVAAQNIAAAKLTSSLSRIVAPRQGVVLRAPEHVGAAVSAQAGPLFVIGEPLSTVRIDASVSETDVHLVRPGQQAEVIVAAAANKSFTGLVERVGIDANRVDGAVLYPIVLLVENPQGYLLPGMTARVRTEVARVENVLAVHEAALRFVPSDADAEPADSRSRVWRKVGKSQLEPVRVKPGISDGVHTQVTPLEGATLAIGDELAVGLAQPGSGSEAPSISLGAGK